jgi:hypothetical protein
LPLVGTICCQDGQPASFDHCKQMSRVGMCDHPLPLLAAMAGESKRRDGLDISSSTLSSCPRQHVLKQRNDYYEDPDDYYARWMGSFSHHAIEHGGPWEGIIQEERMARVITVSGLEFIVSGMPDWYDTTTKHIDDYKFVGWKPKELRPEHEGQVNVYAWILDSYGYEVETARIIYLHQKARDTGKRRTLIDVPVWSDERTEDYIREKLLPHATYRLNGNLSQLRVEVGGEWKGQFCPFRNDCNPGQCCVKQDAPGSENTASLGDGEPGWAVGS